MGEITVRAARPEDAAGMARVHVQAWKETYRGQMPDEVLDAPDAADRRQQMWSWALEDDARGRVAVADLNGDVVGIAWAGPARDEQPAVAHELFVLYLLNAHHGSGAGQQLLDAVLADQASVLWVADPNPRAQAFYRRNGFVPDGARKDEGIAEIRMVRAGRS